MNAREFVDKFGWEEAERVALLAGTTRAYFAQLAGGHRRPRLSLAEQLSIASDGRLAVLDLLTYQKPRAA